jgi:hypothetical protein
MILQRLQADAGFSLISLKNQLNTCVLSKQNIMEDPHAEELVSPLVLGVEAPVTG